MNKDTADFLSRVAPWQKLAEEQLARNLHSQVPLVKKIGDYILESGGKRLRPILFLLSTRLCGRNDDADGRFSSIFEFLHCATLLHDDVIDEAKTRRGRPAAHRAWGNKAVVLAGDYLVARCFSLTSETNSPRAIAALAECTGRLAEGQVLELQCQGTLDLPYETYLEIITAKTAVLLAAACRIGAILAAAAGRPGPAGAEEALHDFGLELGVAFQMIDDYLDWAGDQATMGKPVGQDLIEGKATLPWIHALDRADAATRARMLDLAARPEPAAADWAWVKERVEDLGGFAATLARAEEYKNRAKSRLDAFPATPERTLLADLADYVCRRKK